MATLFEPYIRAAKIVIADTSPASQSALAQALCSMGAQTAHIAFASTYENAMEEIERAQPQIVLSDYDLGAKCGLDLLQQMRLHRPETRDCLFILVTGNSSQAAVAHAAEEDVDTFILKPFTMEMLENAILSAAMAKLDPPAYHQAIDAGKTLLMEGQLESAIPHFESAMTLDPAPSLACFYLGQANLMKNRIEEAESNYSQGLSYNKLHYKCMVGLYEVLISLNRNREAYEVIKKISQHFPANPQRFMAVIRLAIVTQNFSDVERCYRLFTQIDDRASSYASGMVKHLCAALVVCGKHYLQKSLPNRALELFQKAAETAGGRTKILREIIQNLVEFNLCKEAEEYLGRFPPEARLSMDCLAMGFLVLDKTSTPAAILERGWVLLAQKASDPIIYQIMIRRSAEAGHARAAADLMLEARKKAS